MAVYVDTIVLVALLLKEPMSASVTRWYRHCTDELMSAM